TAVIFSSYQATADISLLSLHDALPISRSASNSIDADRFASAQSNNATSFASPVICMYKKRPVIIRKIAKKITIPIVATKIVFLFFFIVLHPNSFTLFKNYFILTNHIMQRFIRILHLKSFYVSQTLALYEQSCYHKYIRS